ncbi:MAG TPA: thiol peroxidase [Polyangiaceae bacterium]
MAKTQFKGSPVNTVGDLPKVGSKAPDSQLVAADLSSKRLSDFAGKKKVLSINPSYDTGVCQATARAFVSRVASRNDAVVLLVSADLPFAQKRFCESGGLDAAITLSTFRSNFGREYGVTLADGPLEGLTARAVIVLDEKDVVRYAELVSEITNEPNYDAALAALG